MMFSHMGWHPASTCRVVVSVLLLSSLEVENWLLLARQKRNMWPMQMTTHAVASHLSTEQFMRRERRRLKAKHIWVALDPQWIKLKERLFTRHVTNLGWRGLHERLFPNEYGSKQRFYENEYQGYDYQEVRAQWLKTRQWFQQSATAHFPSQLALSPHFLQFDYADAKSWGRSIMSHSYGTLSKESTGVKCWQMCGMNPCRCNNKISCLGRQGSW